MSVCTRFAPSPTGSLHIGGLRTAAYAYALARHSGGRFLLRIEDTDRKREVPGAKEKIFEVLSTFGLNWDEVHVQSQRVARGIYRQAADALLSSGHAFLDEGAVRLKIPPGDTVSYTDFVLQKKISWGTDTLENLVLLKSDGFPTYHLAVVVDDHDMGITHVLRGHDWLPSTPIHLLLYRFLGWEVPQIGHLTDILDPGGGKLSKRKGNVSVEQLLNEGYLPEALFNFVILLGWAPKDNREFFTLDEFVSAFDPAGFQKSNPVFNSDKLNWFNGQYIRHKSDTELTQLVKPFVKSGVSDTQITQIIPLVKERLAKLTDFDSLTTFFVSAPQYSAQLWPDPASAVSHLRFAAAEFDHLNDSDFTAKITGCGWKVGDFYMSLRIAVCGSRTTPPLTPVMQILGKKESLTRIQNALQFLGKN